MTTQTEALKRYLDDCDKHAIVPDIAGAFHFAWQEALAQPEQEPAATAYFEKITGRIVLPDDTHRRKFPMCYRPLVFGDAPPHPPQRKPLTDEEIIEMAKKTKSAEPGLDGYILPFSFARAIEAKLKEKNT